MNKIEREEMEKTLEMENKISQKIGQSNKTEWRNWIILIALLSFPIFVTGCSKEDGKPHDASHFSSTGVFGRPGGDVVVGQ